MRAETEGQGAGGIEFCDVERTVLVHRKIFNNRVHVARDAH